MTLKTLIAGGAAALMMVLPGPTAQDAHAASVRVPLDRANPSAGQLSLYLRRLPATQRRQRTVLYLAGGPGSSATAELGAVVRSLGRPARRTTEFVAFDARGTGRSGLFRCDALQRDVTLRSTEKAAACARALGPRRSTATVAEQVEDVEAVRRALKLERIDLLGISYGTEIAQRYVQRYPQRVRRVVLDSVLPPEGPSPLGLELFTGMERVLRAICANERCPKDVPDPAATVAALVPQLRASPLRATVFDARGRAQERTLDPVALLDVLLAGDFSPALRLALPGALAAARQGDAAPLLRLAELDREFTGIPKVREFSVAAYAATSCESLALPWDPAADPATRRAQAAARIAELGDAAFAPFDGQTIVDGDFVPLCLEWPAPPRPPVAPPRELPAVPTLFVAGEEDLRTPVESAREAASRGPSTHTQVLSVRGAGHSALAADDSGCTARAVRRFLAAELDVADRCLGPEPYVPPVPVPPASADALGPGGSPAALARRSLQAIDLTLDDAIVAISTGGRSGGGLRGGRYAIRDRALVLDDYAYVPGVTIDATPRRGGAMRIRIRGAGVAAGSVTLDRDGDVRGVLGGRRVRDELETGPPRL